MKKPTGYGGFLPQLHSRDLAAAVAFYRDVLGFTVDEGIQSADFVMLWAGDGHGQIWHQLGLVAIDREHPPVTGQTLVILTDNLFEMHDRHRAARAEVVGPIADGPWGAKEYVVTAPDGYRLCFREHGYDTRPTPRG